MVEEEEEVKEEVEVGEEEFDGFDVVGTPLNHPRGTFPFSDSFWIL